MASVGASVISGEGVKVAGTNPDFVGGKVAVTKFGRTGVGVSELTETEIQDVSSVVINRVRIIFLFIYKFNLMSLRGGALPDEAISNNLEVSS